MNHHVWCDPARCTTPDRGVFPRGGVHRSREIHVQTRSGPVGLWLFATDRGSGVPHVIVGGMAVPLFEVHRAVAELDALVQPRRLVAWRERATAVAYGDVHDSPPSGDLP